MLTLSNPVSMFSVCPVKAALCVFFYFIVLACQVETRPTGCKAAENKWTLKMDTSCTCSLCRRPVSSLVTATTQSPQHPAALGGHLTCYQEYNSRYGGLQYVLFVFSNSATIWSRELVLVWSTHDLSLRTLKNNTAWWGTFRACLIFPQKIARFKGTLYDERDKIWPRSPHLTSLK